MKYKIIIEFDTALVITVEVGRLVIQNFKVFQTAFESKQLHMNIEQEL